jgi:histone acetyltransferase (RNA polymerase elongator complex component)
VICFYFTGDPDSCSSSDVQNASPFECMFHFQCCLFVFLIPSVTDTARILIFDYSMQSYTRYEPTTMHAIPMHFDPYEQTRAHVERLKAIGHNIERVELIIMGDTSMRVPEDYSTKFITQLHNASWAPVLMKQYGKCCLILISNNRISMSSVDIQNRAGPRQLE